jgi:hypothetical protein
MTYLAVGLAIALVSAAAYVTGKRVGATLMWARISNTYVERRERGATAEVAFVQTMADTRADIV